MPDLKDQVAKMSTAELQKLITEAVEELASRAYTWDGVKRILDHEGTKSFMKPSTPRRMSDGDRLTAPAKTKKRRGGGGWAGLSAADRLARVNAIRKGRGLPPKEA